LVHCVTAGSTAVLMSRCELRRETLLCPRPGSFRVEEQAGLQPGIYGQVAAGGEVGGFSATNVLRAVNTIAAGLGLDDAD
jgi:hypothetical protein